MSDIKLREDLLKVVPDVDALIPQSENEFSDIQKFGLVDSNIYHNLPNDVKTISYLSATLKSELYSKYLDEEAIVWDTATQELLLYIPDKKHPAVAFKGSRWQYARKLKKEYLDPDPSMRRIQIKRMYSIIKYNIKKEIILKTNSHEKDLFA